MNKPGSILITGASSGIGQALACSYAKPGVTLFLTGRNEQRLNEVRNVCTQAGAKVTMVVMDITDVGRVREWIIACDQERNLDMVIANAGISNAGVERSEEYERKIFQVNLFGVLNTVYPAQELMKQRQHGQIVIMSSLAAMYGFPYAPAYCASKAAVKSFGESLRGKLKQFKVGVSVVCPGFIKTPLTDKNEFKMPFLMSVEKATQIIVKKLARNQGLIAFPHRMYFPLWLLRVLPHGIAEKIARQI